MLTSQTPTQESCKECASVLYPHIEQQDIMFAIGQDHVPPPANSTFRATTMFYVAIFARVTENGRHARKLLERGPMSPRVADAWTFLESRMTRAVDKIVRDTEKKANLTTRDRDCRIVFGANTLGASSSDSQDLAPPSYQEAEADARSTGSRTPEPPS